ncbi:MAG: GH92 family glycosyl hydrolase, partial [Bacteroidia bacterium]
FAFLLECKAQQSNYSQYVDPMIGTGGHGHTFPGATVPFGMVQLSPDTRIDGSWDGCSGYHYSDSIIYGFSHTHLSGTGCSDYGDIMIMPTIGEITIDKQKYASGFSHANEKASAGYYEVKLKNKINVELTSTTRVGFHKYTFPETNKANVVLDLTHRDKTLESSLKIISATEVEGMRRSEAWAKDQHIYFVMQFSKPFSETIFINDKDQSKLSVNEDPNAAKNVEIRSDPTVNDPYKGTNIKAVFSFKTAAGEAIYVKVGISTVSIEGARKNLEAELPGWDFEKTKKDAEALWNKELSKIEVTSNDSDKLKTFYSALYHTMIQPNVNMDVDGMYRGRDNKIHEAKGFTYYSVFSLWDTFRAAHPLYTIIDQKRTADFINTFLAQYEQGGRLPVWELASNETDCMIGYHSVSVIADAMLKHIRGFDYEEAFEASKHSAMLDQLGLKAYKQKGFIAMEDDNESVSKTLEYAYDDWCIAQMADLIAGYAKSKNGPKYYNSAYTYFNKRSQSWKNVFDPETGFMRPKKNGAWLSPFEPREVNNNYTEGNAWQYTFFVPQDIHGLIDMMGGKDKFEKKLDELFTTTTATTGREQADISGLIGQYAHGNEPSHHMAYLYNFINKEYKTEARIHQIVNDFYKPSPDGLIGNEDCGQMSAWYVLSSMGFYEVTPGTDQYLIGTPLFNNVKIHLENGNTFTIKANNLTNDNFYVQSKKLYGDTWDPNYITYPSILNGETLEFEMGNKETVYADSDKWLFCLDRSPVDKIIPVPVINTASRVFDDSLKVEIKSNSEVYYAIVKNGMEKKLFNYYKGPFIINSSEKIYAFAEDDHDFSDTISGSFYKRPNHWKIEIKSKYNPQYTAGGDEGIIDGLRGDVNWRKGEWQGYQSQDFEAVIDLQKIMEINKISAGFLQDSRSWILMPTKVEYYTSTDNINFTLAATVTNSVKPDDYTSQIKDFAANKFLQVVKARYVKVKAYNFGKLPEWHQGAGGDAFIFVDEISIQ